MINWNCNILKNKQQDSKYDSFIGGKPKIPRNCSSPRCNLCKEELTFMFQIAFPEGHAWYGKSFAMFFCTKHFHGEFCIPEFPNVNELYGVEISRDFLDKYERNFKLVIFNTVQGVIQENYEEKLIFKPFHMVKTEQMDPNVDFVISGKPIWIMGIDETPGKIASVSNIELLLQVREDYEFEKHSNAKPQDNPYYEQNNYMLFAADRIYFWGTTDANNLAVYISVQSP